LLQHLHAAAFGLLLALPSHTLCLPILLLRLTVGLLLALLLYAIAHLCAPLRLLPGLVSPILIALRRSTFERPLGDLCLRALLRCLLCLRCLLSFFDPLLLPRLPGIRVLIVLLLGRGRRCNANGHEAAQHCGGEGTGGQADHLSCSSGATGSHPSMSVNGYLHESILRFLPGRVRLRKHASAHSGFRYPFVRRCQRA
jgi:hypothetical protein